MNDLIQVNYDHENPTVSGRELHAKLNIETRYNDWFPRMCAYGFREGKDYYSFLSNRSDGLAGKQATDHALSISMVKEICMLQCSEKGREFRQHFISIEEEWNSPDKIMERAWQIIHQCVLDAERRIFARAAERGLPEMLLKLCAQRSMPYFAENGKEVRK